MLFRNLYDAFNLYDALYVPYLHITNIFSNLA